MTAINLTLLPDPMNGGKLTSGIIQDDWVAGQAPVVSGVSGTLSNGQTITITGSNFSKKRNATAFFTNFKNDSAGTFPNGLYSWPNYSNETSKYKVYDSSDSPFGGKAIRATANRVQLSYAHFQFSEDQDEVFFEMWCRINRVAWFAGSEWNSATSYEADQECHYLRPNGEPGGGNIYSYKAISANSNTPPWNVATHAVDPAWQEYQQAQIKMTRIIDGTNEGGFVSGGSGIDAIQESGGTNPQGGFILAAAEDGGIEGAADRRGYGSAPDSTVWAKQTFYVKKSDVDAANGKAYLKIGATHKFSLSAQPPNGHLGAPDGSLISSMHLYDSTQFINNQTGKTNLNKKYRRVMLPYYQLEHQNTIIDCANLLVNDSPERIVVGDASTWDACDHTKSYSLPSVTRDNGVISAEFIESALIPSNRYFYVVNRDGVYNQNGFLRAG